MPNNTKSAFLEELSKRYGKIYKLENSLSLYDVGEGAARIYIRYSKVHSKGQTFYGLRKNDLQQLEGYPSVVCFLWEGQKEPLFIPYSDYEDIFHSISPASDGQYKVQIYLQEEGNSLYIANAGRFNAEAYWGWQQLHSIIETSQLIKMPLLSHFQVQTLIGSIGMIKGFDIWIPRNDRGRLDWSIADPFECMSSIPQKFYSVEGVLSQIDVIWIDRGASKLRALFEVEHSTPIYSGLLRFNDIHLSIQNTHATYNVVADNERRSVFVNQLNRPTFKISGLDESCTFMEYKNVFSWHKRIYEDRNE